MKKSAAAVAVVLCLILLLLQPALAASGAKNGLLLWANVILPTLLPFMICVGAVTALDGIPIVTKPFYPLLKGLFGLSRQGSFAFISGLLCGYPIGAKVTGDLVERGEISRREAQILLAICNHPSPMFLLGFVMPRMIGVYGGKTPCPWWAAALALYLPIIPVVLLAGQIYAPASTQISGSGTPTSSPNQPSQPASPARPVIQTSSPPPTDTYHSTKPCPDPFSFDAHLMSCFETMVKIGGYIMLFSIFSQYLSALPLPVPPAFRSTLLGIVEITTGVEAISRTTAGPMAAALILSCTAFGGVSGIFQTKSVLQTTQKAGLSVRHYTLWKLLHSIITYFLFLLLNQCAA